MAIDTRSKRASILGFCNPTNITLPFGTAGITAAERQQVAYSFAGLLADEPAIGTGAGRNIMMMGIGLWWLFCIIMP
jgi:hypothetical protein